MLATITTPAAPAPTLPNPAAATQPRPAWCATCRRIRAVEDVTTESEFRPGYGEVTARVEYLDCGHNRQGAPTVVGPAPGAPYADLNPPAPADPWADYHTA